ncbi:hypothetical protein M9H77_21279 [Catharanthus roseus]|uniref:Uncharacterized protein n=1 Tax=Catharanthus roseus TaxID=4058 RepID=A0ACC0AMW9_CATRO|nr:hypothetical protein M9H77_21279 [Catharanthus roseus]
MGVRLFVIERSYVVWLVFDYEMPELSSDGLVLGIRTLSVEPHCCITCSFKIGHRAALMCLDSLRLPSCARNPPVGSSIGFLVPRGTQMPYSAAVDLVAGLGASQVVSEH